MDCALPASRGPLADCAPGPGGPRAVPLAHPKACLCFPLLVPVIPDKSRRDLVIHARRTLCLGLVGRSDNLFSCTLASLAMQQSVI